MMAASVEYQTVQENREILKKAMEDSILFISGHLVKMEMITPENHTELKNNALGKHEKVELLMSLIETRIQVSPANLAKFVGILKLKSKYYSKAIQILQVALRDESPPAAPHGQLLKLTEHIGQLEGRVKELEQHQLEGVKKQHTDNRRKDGNQHIKRKFNICLMILSVVVWILTGITLIMSIFIPEESGMFLTMIWTSISAFLICLFKPANIKIMLLVLYAYITAYLQYKRCR
jgi:hypothetical protein